MRLSRVVREAKSLIDDAPSLMHEAKSLIDDARSLDHEAKSLISEVFERRA